MSVCCGETPVPEVCALVGDNGMRYSRTAAVESAVLMPRLISPQPTIHLKFSRGAATGTRSLRTAEGPGFACFAVNGAERAADDAQPIKRDVQRRAVDRDSG